MCMWLIQSPPTHARFSICFPASPLSCQSVVRNCWNVQLIFIFEWYLDILCRPIFNICELTASLCQGNRKKESREETERAPGEGGREKKIERERDCLHFLLQYAGSAWSVHRGHSCVCLPWSGQRCGWDEGKRRGHFHSWCLQQATPSLHPKRKKERYGVTSVCTCTCTCMLISLISQSTTCTIIGLVECLIYFYWTL